MKISPSALPKIRLTVLIVFAVVCVTIFGYLWVNSGGRLPVISNKGYRVSLNIPKVSNLVPNSDVTIAGVRIGRVVNLEPSPEGARVTLQLDHNAPLHQGTKAQVREKTLVNETFVQLADGTGAPLANGTTLPPGSGKPAVQVNDVLQSLDPGTRDALGATIRSSGVATAGTRGNLQQTLNGLGDLGHRGKNTLSALSAQSDDLRKLTGSSATLIAALNTRQGRIAEMVQDSNQLAQVTSDNHKDVEAVVQKLPGVLDSARHATPAVNDLSSALGPVASDLNAAAPGLSHALVELPQTSASLRGALPKLDGVLQTAPPTLTRIPSVASEANQLIPNLQADLSQVNPMLTYLQPYGPDVAHMFVNWGASLPTGNVDGKALRLLPVLSPQAPTGVPLNTNIGPLNRRDPYPAPAQGDNPGPWKGSYPRVQKEGPPR